MAKNTAPQQPTADDDDLPQTGVTERESVRRIREQQARNSGLADYVEDGDNEPAQDVWQKRYGDLRRHSQKQESEANKRIRDLEAQIGELQQAVNRPVPVDREQLEAWKAQYPQLAAAIDAMAEERATARASVLEQRLSGLSEELAETKKERSYALLKSLVPDIEEVVASPEWQAYVQEQSPSIRNIITNTEDPHELAQQVRQFKTIQGLRTSPNTRKPKADNTGVLDAAVRGGAGQGSTRNPSYKFTVMQIKAMSPQEFEKFETEIDEARKAGLILDDSQRKVYHTDYR